MKTLSPFLSVVAAALLMGCRPDPIEIEVPQSSAEMTISSATPDRHTLYVSAGYSISSMKRLADTSTLSDYRALPQDMLIDSAIVLLRADGGRTDTLQRLGKGLYGRKDLDLEPYAGYTLIVDDRKKGRSSTARTSFMPALEPDSMYVYRRRQGADTLSRLRLRIPGVQPGERLLVCYNTSAALRLQQRILNRDISALYDFQPKRLELLQAPQAAAPAYTTELTLQVEATDTVLVQVSRMDAGLFDYLSAYKRSGNLFTQLSGEPVNLPGNIQKGFGYFSMYLSRSAVFDLKKEAMRE